MVRRRYGVGIDFSTALQPTERAVWELFPLASAGVYPFIYYLRGAETYGFSFGFFHISIR